MMVIDCGRFSLKQLLYGGLPGSQLVLAVVLLHLQHLHDIGVPRLDIHGKCSGALPASLVNVPAHRTDRPKWNGTER